MNFIKFGLSLKRLSKFIIIVIFIQFLSLYSWKKQQKPKKFENITKTAINILTTKLFKSKLDQYFDYYSDMCEREIRGRISHNDKNKPLCDCLPKNLGLYYNLSFQLNYVF